MLPFFKFPHSWIWGRGAEGERNEKEKETAKGKGKEKEGGSSGGERKGEVREETEMSGRMRRRGSFPAPRRPNDPDYGPAKHSFHHDTVYPVRHGNEL